MHLSRAHRTSVVAGNSVHPKRHAVPHATPIVHGSLREYVTRLQARAHGECADLLRKKHIANMREPLQDHEKMPRTREEHEFELRHGKDVPRCGTLVALRSSGNKAGVNERVMHVLVVQEVQRTCLTVDMRWDASQSTMQEAAMWRELVAQIEDLMACHGACHEISGDKSASLNLALQWHLTASTTSSVGGVRNVGVSKAHCDRFKSPHEVLFEQQFARKRLHGGNTVSFVEECRRSYPSMSITHMSRVHAAQTAHGVNEGVHMTFKCAVVRFVRIPRAMHHHLAEAIAHEGGYVADNRLDSVKQTIASLPLGRMSYEHLLDSDSDEFSDSDDEEEDETEEEEEEIDEDEEEEEEDEEEQEEEVEMEVPVTPEEARRARMTRMSEASERARIEAERIEQIRLAEQARIAAEKAEQERIIAEKAERNRLAAEKAEQERIAAEATERARIVAENAERARIAAEEAEQAALLASPTTAPSDEVEEIEEFTPSPKRASEEEEEEVEDEINDQFTPPSSPPPLVENISDMDESDISGSPVSTANEEEEVEQEQEQQEPVRSVGQAEVEKWSQDFVALVNGSNHPYVDQMVKNPPSIVSAATIGQDLYPQDLREKITERLTAGEDRATNLFAIIYDSVHPTNEVTMQMAAFATEMDVFARKLPSNLMDLHDETVAFITSNTGLNYKTVDVVRACPVAFDVVFTTFLTSYIVSPLVWLFYNQLEEASKTYDKLSVVQLDEFAKVTNRLTSPTDKSYQHLRTQVLEFKNAVDKETRLLTDTLVQVYRVDSSTVERETELVLGVNREDNQRRIPLPRKYTAVGDSDVLRQFSVLAELLKVVPIKDAAPVSPMPTIMGSGKKTRSYQPIPLVRKPLESSWGVTQSRYKNRAVTSGEILDGVTNAILRVTRVHVLTTLRDKRKSVEKKYGWPNHLGADTNRTINTGELTNFKSLIDGHSKTLAASTDINAIEYLKEKNTPTFRLCYLQRVLSIANVLLRPTRLVRLISDHFGADQVDAILGDDVPNPLTAADSPEKYLQLQTLLLARAYVTQIVRAQYSVHKVLASLSSALQQSNGEFWRVFGNQMRFVSDAAQVRDNATVLFDSAINRAYGDSTPAKNALEIALGWTQGVMCHMEANSVDADNELFDIARRDLYQNQGTVDLVEKVVDVKQLMPQLSVLGLGDALYMDSFAPSSSSSPFSSLSSVTPSSLSSSPSSISASSQSSQSPARTPSKKKSKEAKRAQRALSASRSSFSSEDEFVDDYAQELGE